MKESSQSRSMKRVPSRDTRVDLGVVRSLGSKRKRQPTLW